MIGSEILEQFFTPIDIPTGVDGVQMHNAQWTTGHTPNECIRRSTQYIR